MYFPYLYGLASELLALRDLVGSEYAGPVLPIIEPVKSDTANLRRALEAIDGSSLQAVVVTNPSLGELRTAAAQRAWSLEAAPIVRRTHAIPAIEVDASTSASQVRSFVDSFPTGDLAVSARAGGAALAAIVAGEMAGRATRIVCHHDVDDADFSAEFGVSNVIRLNDSFNRQPRNADYEGAEWFSSANRSFGPAGRPGFGDYTVMSPLPMDTRGGPAGAVVVHATYIDGSGDLWVEHYVSDTTDRDEGTAAEKLLEALAKLRPDRSKYLDSPGMSSFDSIRDLSSRTSLSMNKRLQISHHLFTAGAAF